MSIGIGLSLPIGLTPNDPAHDEAVQELVLQAIQGRLRVKASFEGAKLIVEPYALVDTHNSIYVSAVVVYSDQNRYRGFEPRYLDVAKLDDVMLLADQFLPNWAFDPGDFPDEAELVAAIERVDPA